MVTSKTILAALLVGLAGCVKKPEGSPPIEDPAYTRYDVGAYYVREFHLRDGSRCVVVHETGITCEWRQPKVEL